MIIMMMMIMMTMRIHMHCAGLYTKVRNEKGKYFRLVLSLIYIT